MQTAEGKVPAHFMGAGEEVQGSRTPSGSEGLRLVTEPAADRGRGWAPPPEITEGSMSAFTVQSYVPVTTPIRAFVVPDNVAIDVLTDQFPGVGPGDYVQVDENDAPIRSWKKTEFEAAYQLG